MPQTELVASILARMGRARGWVRAALTVLCLIMAPGPAHAAYVCTYTSTGVAFGLFTGAAVSITGTFSITCTGSGTSTLRINLSAGSGTFAQRHMSQGANILNYNLYTTAAHATIWGDGTSGTSFLNPANSNGLTHPGTFTMTVFGLLPAQALPASGTYQDTVTATLTCTNGGACTTAATQNQVVPITATVGATCTVSSSNLDFGNYVGGAPSPTTGLATITANCPVGEPYAIGLSEGLYPGATTTTRRMMITGGGGDASLGYHLCTDAACTVNWGNNFGGAVQDVVQGTGNGTDQEIPVHGRIDPGQNVRTGLYEDTILVTLTY